MQEVIDVDAAVENTMVVFSAIEGLRKDTKEGWKKLAVPLDQVIEANNTSNRHLKQRDVDISAREGIMDRRVARNCVRVNELQVKVRLESLTALEVTDPRCLDRQSRGQGLDPGGSGRVNRQALSLWQESHFGVILCRRHRRAARRFIDVFFG